MSKRYGRNQKRKHRERIATLEVNLQLVTSERDHALSRFKHMVRELDRIAPYSAVMPPKHMHDHALYYVSIPRRREVTLAPRVLDDVPVIRDVLTISMGEITVWLEKHRDTLETRIHALIPTEDGGVRYSASLGTGSDFHLFRYPQDWVESVTRYLLNSLIEATRAKKENKGEA